MTIPTTFVPKGDSAPPWRVPRSTSTGAPMALDARLWPTRGTHADSPQARLDKLDALLAQTSTSALAVPASLHASLMARLDRLGPAKELAQIGAAIGREFSHALLAAVVRKPDGELESTLDRL